MNRVSVPALLSLFVVVLLAVFLVTSGVLARDLVVRYHRPDADYDGWTLWVWPAGGEGREVLGAPDPFGMVFRVPLDAFGDPTRIGLLPKWRNWDGKDDPDRFWTPDLGEEVYLLTADRTVYATPPDTTPRILKALVDAPDRIRLVLSRSAPAAEIHAGVVSIRRADGAYVPVASAAPSPATAARAKIVDVTLGEAFDSDGGGDAWRGGVALFGAYRPAPLTAGAIVDRLIDTGPLGAHSTPERTTFRVFAPTAVGVSVALYDGPTGGEARLVPMTRTSTGVWEASVEGDLAGTYYKYRADHGGATYEGLDPYSRSHTDDDGRSLIFRDETRVAPPPTFPPRDAIIYEMHIRDFTIDPASGVTRRGKYLGLTEEGTRLAGASEITTGLDHLKDLGVNVVQIMPFQDFDNDEASEAYNWGYMPFHFNAPDGWYATRRDDATRVREVKAMVDALHRAGIKVVMDVVYNHTAEGNPEVRRSFNALAPDFYYRRKEDGSYWNGSGCGNEFRTEVPMARRFIVDSLRYWIEEYGIDGFRFDLMGLIDLETLDAIVREVRALKPDALIYGEPWAGGATGVRVTSTGDQRGRGFGVFHADFRDALRGGVFSREPGWLVDGRDRERVKRGLLGGIHTFSAAPEEAIQYIEAHDNHTLFDRLHRDGRARGLSEEEIVRADLLGAATILTSQGIPFLQSGQEFLRTKNGHENSYNAPDAVNMIHWVWKREHPDVYLYYRGLIRLRRAHPIFRQPSAEDVRQNLFFLDDHLGLPVPQNAIGYILHKGRTEDSWESVAVLLNPNPWTVAFELPPAVWTPVVNDARAGDVPLGAPLTGDRVYVAPRSALVLYSP